MIRKRSAILAHALMAFLLMLLAGCVKSQFAVECDLPADYSSALRVVYFAVSGKQAFRVETTIPVNNGKGKVTLPGKKPMVIAVMPLSTGSEPSLWIYAERGDKITISGTSQTPLDWTVGGNSINEDWSEWRRENSNVLKGRSPQSINAAIAKYVKGNPENPLSTLLLLTTYDRGADEKGYASAWALLKGEALNMKYINAAARSDQMDEMISEPEPLSKLEVYVKGDSMLKINPASHERTLLLFWSRSDMGSEQTLSRLKDIRKEKNDSARMLVADISFDLDTVAWASALRRDSIDYRQKEWVRGWLPGGVMNSQLAPLQIPSTPYIIVVDKKGKQLYRGADLDKALSRL